MGAPWPDGPAVAAKGASIDEARQKHWSVRAHRRVGGPKDKDPRG